MGICESCARCGTKRQYMKTNLKVSVNHLPASNDWSISRKGFVLFSAITFVYCQSLLSLLPALSFCLLIFSSDGVSCLFASPLSYSLTFSLSSLLFSRFACLPQRETWCTQTDWWITLTIIRVYGGGKAMLSHFLLFCSKWAGVAYLPRTEILVVRRWGVAAIASFIVISFRLINAKVCVTFVAIVGNIILR